MKSYSINALYGSNNTPCTVFIVSKRNGQTWYVAQGGTIINCTLGEVLENESIELIEDVACITVSSTIDTLEQLEDKLTGI